MTRVIIRNVHCYFKRRRMKIMLIKLCLRSSRLQRHLRLFSVSVSISNRFIIIIIIGESCVARALQFQRISRKKTCPSSPRSLDGLSFFAGKTKLNLLSSLFFYPGDSASQSAGLLGLSDNPPNPVHVSRKDADFVSPNNAEGTTPQSSFSFTGLLPHVPEVPNAKM